MARSCSSAELSLSSFESKIDQRIEAIFGRFRKCFEGGISEEKLGPKFGEYGSFLPIHLRSSLKLSQHRISTSVHNRNVPLLHGKLECAHSSSLNDSLLEPTPSPTTVQSCSTNSLCSTSKYELLMDKSRTFEKPIKVHQPIKVRLKVAVRKATINEPASDCNLDHNNNPSSLFEGSMENNNGLHETPSVILKTKMSSTVPVGPLLSCFEKGPSEVPQELVERTCNIKNDSVISSDQVPLSASSSLQGDSMAVNSTLEQVANGDSSDLWVCCDDCDKWRLLPLRTDCNKLPTKWTCDMQSWLPGLNKCTVSEDATIKAFNALQNDQSYHHRGSKLTPSEGCHHEGKLKQLLQISPISESRTKLKTPTFDMMGLKKRKKKKCKALENEDGKRISAYKLIITEASDKGHKKRKRSSKSKTHDFCAITSKKKSTWKKEAAFEKCHVTVMKLVDSNCVNKLEREIERATSGISEVTSLDKSKKNLQGTRSSSGKLVSSYPYTTSKSNKYETSRSIINDTRDEYLLGAVQSLGVVKESSELEKPRESGALKTPLLVNSVRGVHLPGESKNNYMCATKTLKEATDLKHSADHLKNVGQEDEITSIYFYAALKFLIAASLLEVCNKECATLEETTQVVKIYIDTAKLFMYCVVAFERIGEMAAVALVYKCMEVTYMRVLFSMTSHRRKDQNGIQQPWRSPSLGHDFALASASILHNAPPESKPRKEKAPGCIITSRHPSPHGLLEYSEYACAAMDALQKSLSTFKAVKLGNMSQRKYSEEEILTVKRALDFHYYNVDGFVRMIRLALEEINI